MTNEMPYYAWMAPPPTEIPNYVWSKRYDSKPLKIRSSKLIEIKIEEFYHPSKEVALKAAKMAVRGKSGMYFGSKVVGFVRPAAVHIRTPLAAEALESSGITTTGRRLRLLVCHHTRTLTKTSFRRGGI